MPDAKSSMAKTCSNFFKVAASMASRLSSREIRDRRNVLRDLLEKRRGQERRQHQEPPGAFGKLGRRETRKAHRIEFVVVERLGQVEAHAAQFVGKKVYGATVTFMESISGKARKGEKKVCQTMILREGPLALNDLAVKGEQRVPRRIARDVPGKA